MIVVPLCEGSAIARAAMTMGMSVSLSACIIVLIRGIRLRVEEEDCAMNGRTVLVSVFDDGGGKMEWRAGDKVAFCG